MKKTSKILSEKLIENKKQDDSRDYCKVVGCDNCALKNCMWKTNVGEVDAVNRPAHYTDGKIEVIDFIEDKKLGFCLGNAVKYISRAGKKDPTKEVEDLRKAAWYIDRRIKELEGLCRD